MAELNPPRWSTLRILEITDIITDVFSFGLLVQVYKEETAVVSLITTSLVFSFIMNFFRNGICHRAENPSYAYRKRQIALGIALVACEDLVMIPANFFAILITSLFSSDAGVYLDLLAVALSLIVGLVVLCYKLTNGVSDAICGNRKYEGDVGVLEQFVEWERYHNETTCECCRDCSCLP